MWWPTDAEGEAERIMQQMVYTPEELERIQMGVLALLCYAKRHDRRELPRCFLFCRTMVKNIDLCREGADTLQRTGRSCRSASGRTGSAPWRPTPGCRSTISPTHGWRSSGAWLKPSAVR